jgi:hypothetical protein
MMTNDSVRVISVGHVHKINAMCALIYDKQLMRACMLKLIDFIVIWCSVPPDTQVAFSVAVQYSFRSTLTPK